MPLIPEFTIAIALGGLLLAYIVTRFLNSRPGYLARKNDILDSFQLLRTKSLRTQEALSNYVLSNNAAQSTLEGNITYKDFLKELQRNHIQNLADKNYARLKKTHNRVALRQAKIMLLNQEEYLKSAENRLKGIL